MRFPIRTIRSQLLTSLLAIIVFSGLAAYITNTFWASRALDEMVQSNDRLTARTLAESLAAFYQLAGSWDGVAAEVAALKTRYAEQFGRDEPSDHPGPDNDVPLILADREGNKVYDGLERRDRGTKKASRERMETSTAQAVEIGGQTVGYLQFKSMITRGFSRGEQAFLNSINTSLAVTLTLQIVVALALGLALSARFVRPIRLLEEGVKRIAEGKSREQVAVSGENEIAWLAKNFNRMVDQLEAQEQSRRNLFADAAHELRTPVAILQANLEMMIEGVYPADRERLMSLHEETQLLTKLIGDLRTISDLELGIVDTAFETVRLGPLVEECAGSHQPFFREKQIELKVVVGPGTLQVRGDPHRLVQVLGNLLENSLRYAEGSPSVEVTVETVSGDTGGPDHVRVSVNDQGPGVPEPDLPRIFDRFFRSELSRNRGKGGRGLGLAIGRQIIEASGGRMGAANRQPRGLSVWFELPAE